MSENKIGTRIWEAQPGDSFEEAKLKAVNEMLPFLRHGGVLYELCHQVVARPLGRLDVIPPDRSDIEEGDIVATPDGAHVRVLSLDGLVAIGQGVAKCSDGCWYDASELTLVEAGTVDPGRNGRQS